LPLLLACLSFLFAPPIMHADSGPPRPDLRQQDIETVYLEITSHAPAGATPHAWK
jgi:hypothetical protein